MGKFTFRPARTAALVLAIAIAAAACETSDTKDALEGASLHDILLKSATASGENYDYRSAAAAYRTLYLRDHDDIDIALGYARNLRFVGALKQAAEVLDRALKDHPDHGGLLAERGKVEMARSRPVRALEFLERAVERDPDDWRTHSAIGIARDFTGQYELARRSYHAALKLSPDNPAVLNNLALSHALANNIDIAIGMLTKLASQPDASVQSRQNLALLLAWKGDMVEAENLARRDLEEATVVNNMNYFRSLAGAPPAKHEAPDNKTTPPSATGAAVP